MESTESPGVIVTIVQNSLEMQANPSIWAAERSL